MALVLITPPTDPPVSVPQAKAQLRCLSADEDGRIGELVGRATRHVESKAGVQLMRATWRLTLDRFPPGRGVVELRRPPVAEVTEVRYFPAAGGPGVVLDPSAYDADLESKPGRLRPVDGTTWPATARKLNAVSVTFKAGAAAAADVPQTAVQLILLLVERWFEPQDDGRAFGSAEAAIESLLMDLKWAGGAGVGIG